MSEEIKRMLNYIWAHDGIDDVGCLNWRDYLTPEEYEYINKLDQESKEVNI